MSWNTLLILFLLNYSLINISAINVTNFRLPNNTKPHLYEIEFDFDFFGKYLPVTGKSFIHFEVIEPTDTITLHKANNVKINEEYTKVEHQKIVEQSWSSEEVYKIKLSNYLTLGNYSLELRWIVNNSNPKNLGFFYFYDKDKNRLVAGTKNLIPAYARRVFPCWDEPFYKSKFKFSVKHPKNLTALSNMPEINRESDGNDKILTHFQVSPKLSPHSIGIALTNFDFIKNQHGNLTFFSIKNNSHKIQHLLNITSKILSRLENYTKIPYPVPKLDVIILPYIPSGLKNLGLMILNSEEINILEVESELALHQYKKSEAIILAEALSLQWFGNLVTPIWWDDLWLAYGISNFVAAEIINQIFENETIKSKNWLTIDAYKSYHGLMLLSPIRFANPKGIKKQLDSFQISRYVQMVQMLEHIVTNQVFQTGLQKYLNKNKFSAVTTEDLWDSFADNNKLNLKQLMDPWLETPGYAILEVSHDQKTNSVRIVQKNALQNYSNVTRMIPINFATKSNPNFSNTTPVFWMDQNETLISLVDKDDWIIFNVQQLDQYQVTYDEENWRRIINYLNTEDFYKIHPINRAIIVSELNERIINDENLDIIFNLLAYLRREKNLLPLWSAYNLIFKLSGQLTRPLVHSYSQFIALILEPVIRNLEESNTVDNYFYKEAKSLKLLFMRIFCTLKRTEYCKNFANETVDYILTHPAEQIYLHDYCYSWTLCSVLNEYDEDQWNYFFSNRYPFLQNHLYWKYTYLKCARSATVVQKYFPKLLQDNIATSVDQFMMIFNFVMKYADEDIIQIMMEYFIDNFDLLQERFRDKLFNEVVFNMIIEFSDFIKSETQWSELTKFLILKRQELDEQYNFSIVDDMNDHGGPRIKDQGSRIKDQGPRTTDEKCEDSAKGPNDKAKDKGFRDEDQSNEASSHIQRRTHESINQCPPYLTIPK
ncbi:thyrotropin-releasing hormone-degrading ectoenzyme-like [Cotesia glomerata]|uniref:thyrotropin-releasing hormone-degrading ectoenzyme-like n=1 Tax=Cotesia glomerata TaxID=32391 RepID=UPI001D00DEBB|nr:thyrotropin-releasing hormone-degrading ectoenzyme-like [Cotesia glomerata]